MVGNDIVPNSGMHGERHIVAEGIAQDRGGTPRMRNLMPALGKVVLGHDLQQLGARWSQRMAGFFAQFGFEL